MPHCDGYCAAALVRATDLAGLGIDAEPHQTLPAGVIPAVSLPVERDRLRRLAGSTPGI
jgi:enterobactin synthetase component D / holo-[acyl-carrier protein] synthase